MSTVSILFNYGIVLTLIGTSVSYVVLPEDWGYHLGVLPDKWETLYPECNGKQQSPIDIKTQNVVYDGCLQRFYFSGLQRVSGVNMTLENNGHAVQVDLTGTDLEVNSGSLPGAYDIDQFHFHWGSEDSRGSEHEIDGKHYSMEMHVVMHSKTFASSKDAMKSKNGLAVLGFFIDIGCHNHEFEKLINHLGQIQHKDDHVNMASFSLTDLFPSTQHYYRYYGSLTTPPCYESVIWTIFKNHIYMSESQITEFLYFGPSAADEAKIAKMAI